MADVIGPITWWHLETFVTGRGKNREEWAFLQYVRPEIHGWLLLGWDKFRGGKKVESWDHMMDTPAPKYPRGFLTTVRKRLKKIKTMRAWPGRD